MKPLVQASSLRAELSALNRAYAQRHRLAHKESYGQPPTIVYEPDRQKQRHGNFLSETYRAISANPEWKRRFEKSHPQSRALPKPEHGRWKELDSSNSSDALLMNVFCHPATLKSAPVCSMLGVERGVVPIFGFKARVPLRGGLFDRTEVDMKLDDLLVESKLTETDFQQKRQEVVENYRDFSAVFDREGLPRAGGDYLSYQLIRNVLAAYATGYSFCVMADARRPDLIEAWHAVMRAVQPIDLRLRCKVLTWQELCERLPRQLQSFLAEKYGIVPS